MMYFEFNHGYASEKKDTRRVIFMSLIKAIQELGSKLEPVPLDAIYLFERNNKKIYKVYNMTKCKFGKVISGIDPEAQFFGTQMHGYGGVKRVRKFAYFYMNNKPYLLMQQSVDFNNTMSLLDIDGKKRYKLKNLEQVQALSKILSGGVEAVPLLINDPEIQRNATLKGIVNELLGNN